MSPPAKPLVALTMGDPCGIGPEVILRALTELRDAHVARLAVIGSDAVLRRVADRLGVDTMWLPVRSGNLRALSGRCVPLLTVGRCRAASAMAGKATVAGGRWSVRWVERAVDMALSGEIDAMVTAPINKQAIHMAGETWPGHTEMIAARTQTPHPVMMMVGRGVRAALVTTHVAIKDLPQRITRTRVLDTICVTAHDLTARFGIAEPRLLVCGLNPHSGEAGRFGREEQRAIVPAVAAARRQGIDCLGPVPADVAFVPERRRRFHAIVAMYHDQACIPVKMLAFHTGVNVTLGLPIVRTSPDHGTAYDIAPTGVANPGSMVAAIKLAARMAHAAGRAR